MLLLHYDACATVINGSAHIPKDVTQDPEIRSMLEGESCMSRLSFNSPSGLVNDCKFVCLCARHRLVYGDKNLGFYFPHDHQRRREQRRGNRRRNFWKLHEKETFQL